MLTGHDYSERMNGYDFGQSPSADSPVPFFIFMFLSNLHSTHSKCHEPVLEGPSLLSLCFRFADGYALTRRLVKFRVKYDQTAPLD